MSEFDAVEILIVEDNPSDAELIVRALKKNNLANRLIIVDDGEQALDFIFCRGKFATRKSSVVPRVVFLDLKLPKIHGLDVLRQIKADETTSRIPVVVVTSSREDPDIRAAYKLGANSYVVKPVDFEAFVKAMSDTGMYWLLINQPPG